MQPEERQLSDRERTVLLLAAEGLTDKQIAKHLNLSQRTIGTYWERMRLKLGQYSRTQLVARFLRVEAESDPESANFRNLFATWEEGVWILSPSGETIYANHRIATLFGFTPEEFQDRDARTLFQKSTSTTIDKVLEASQPDPQVMEFRLRRQDGTSVWLRMRSSVVTDARGRVAAILLLLHDTTVQQRVTHTLKSCETTLAFLSEHSSDLIARFDSGLRCVSLNPSFTHLLGVNESEVVGRLIGELGEIFRPVENWTEALRAALSTSQPQKFRDGLFGEAVESWTHLHAEPSPEFLPETIICITTRSTPSV